MVNRTALIFKYRELAVRWINKSDPNHENPGITVESVNDERTVYLISDEDGDTLASVERWVKINFEAVFEEELSGWYTDPSLWPKKLTLKLFKEWFAIEYHTVLIDTVGGSIFDDGV